MKNISSIQEAIWLTQNIYTESSLYNVGGYALITGQLNKSILIRSIEEVLRNADVIEIGYYAFNELKSKDNPAFTRYEIGTIDFQDAVDPDRSCLDWMQADMNENFDVSKNILKIRLLKSHDTRYYWYTKVHHLIFDGYSMSLLFNKVSALYAAYSGNCHDEVKEELYPYADFVEDDKTYRTSQEFLNDRSFWLDRLNNVTGATAFQSCLRYANTQSLFSRRKEIRISRDLYDRISLFCTTQSCTAFHYFISIMLVLNKHYNNNETPVIGLPVFNRRNKRFKNTLGTFVNILPFSIALQEGSTFPEILHKVKQELKDCYKHQRFSLYDFLYESDRKGNIYDISFSYQKNSYNMKLGDLLASITYIHSGEQQEQLAFHLLEYSATEDLTLAVDYREDLFSGEIINGLLDHFSNLLFKSLDAVHIPFRNLDFLHEKTKRFLLEDLNDTVKSYPGNRTIPDLFEDQVSRNPDKIAVVFEEISLTYKDLNERANQLANYLRINYGIGPDDVAAIKLERSEWMIISIMGVLKSGGAYMPIDPGYPEERIGYIISNSGCKVIIDEQELLKFTATRKKYDKKNVSPVNKPNNLIYVIYTSGSTGRPKGCMLEHGGLINRIEWMWRQFGFNADDVILQKTNFTFDVSVWEILMPLGWGARLVICRKEDARSPERILSLIEDHGITCLHFVPGMLNAFIVSLNNAKNFRRSLGSLQRVITSGEALLPETVRRWYDKTDIPLCNLYGPTEASIDVTYYVTSRKDIGIPIGRPIWNTQIYITGKWGQLLPVGVAGEICIGGAGLARGYLNQPELTSEKFIANPFKEGTRMYRTGDMGRWMPDGNIEFIGRTDDQVKIRGYRVELGEIESALQTHPEIDSAAVVAREREKGDKELVACIVSRQALNTVDIRAYLNKILPDYMVPGYFIQIGSMPLTSSGKVDRKKLTGIQGVAMSTGIEYIAPRNRTEQKLTLIWQQLLGKGRIGVKDEFFGSGGHSLKATRLAGLIHKEFNVRLTIKELFDTTILEEQVRLIDAAKKDSFTAIERATWQLHYPLSSSQRRLWVLSQFEESNIAYNMPGVYVLEGDLNLRSLEHSFNALIARHEILRTLFREDTEGEVRQFILSPQEVDFHITWLDLRTEEKWEEKAGRLAKAALNSSFRLFAAPLLRVELYRVADNKWLLVYVMHHIIGDGRSMEILIKELGQLYHSHSRGKKDPLPPLSIQYKDYAAWQQQRLKGIRVEESRQYWLNQLDGELPVLDLPIDNVRPAVKTYNGSVIYRCISPVLTEGIKALSRQQDATFFMGLLTAVNILLYRYSNQKDIIIGSPVAGREHIDLEEQVGFYVNTLLLRSRLAPEDNYAGLLRQVRQLTLEGYTHQDYPFDELVDELDLRRDMTRNALFDVMVTLQNADSPAIEGLEFDEVLISRYEEVDIMISKFDLTFSFTEMGRGSELSLEYNSDLFAEKSIIRMADHFIGLLEQIVAHPETSIAKLEYMSGEEKCRLLEEFNDTEVSFPLDKTVMDLFGEQVKMNPAKIALVYENISLTYGELNKRANRLGHYLRKNYNIGPNDLVGVKLERSERLIMAIFGILKSGGAYLPLDPEYPLDRIDYMLEDSQCRLVIDAEELDRFREVEEEYEEVDLPRVNKGDDLMYVIYTSGSTGRPKGAMVKQGSFTNLVLWYRTLLEMREEDCILVMAPISFDLAQKNIFTPLTGGARLCLSQTLYGDYGELAGTIARHNVTVVNAAPSAFYPLLNKETNAGYEKLSTLRRVVLGGEPIRVDEFYDWIGSGRCNGKVINSYGPTECTDVVSCYTIGNDEWKTIKKVPIGKPVNNVRLYILDDEAGLVPAAITGEICVAGVCVGRGYINKPELTAEKFVPDPFRKGERMYKTGDLGRWLSDGSIEFLGRKDNQIKVRGYRVEPGEIESALQSHPVINAAVVIVRNNAAGEQDLLAYIVSGQRLNTADLRSYLARTLSAFMIPDFFVQLERLPLTPSGKIDRKNLPHPEVSDMTGGIEYIASRNETEKRLTLIWQEILKLEKVGVKDDFFNLGGHSLKATRLAGRIHKEFNVKMSLKELFSKTTLEEQAQWIGQARRASFMTITPALSQPDYPLSSSQRRLWILSQFDEANVAYNMAGVYVLTGHLDTGSLAYAFDSLISRHEILRTLFGENEQGEIRQVILPPAAMAFRIATRDLRDDPERDDLVKRLVKDEFNRPFSLSSGPLLRASIFQMENSKWIFAYVMHHIVSDGWSMELLIKELLLFYNAHRRKEANPLFPLRIHYKDYASWQREQSDGAAEPEQQQYWLKQLGGELPVSDLRGDRIRPAIKTYNGARIMGSIDQKLTGEIKTFCQEQNATLFMGLLTVINTLLYRYTGQKDILIGTPIAGREHADLEEQIGFYVNTLVLRTRLTGEDSFRTILEKVKVLTMEAYEHQMYPFDDLVQALQPERDMSRNALFDIMVVLQNDTTDSRIYDQGLHELQISRYEEVEPQTSKFDLLFDFMETGDTIGITLEYNTDIYDKNTAERLLLYFHQWLDNVLKEPDRAVCRLNFLSQAEQDRQLLEFNDTQGSFARDKTIVDLFEAQAVKSAGTIAVEYEDKTITYRELDELSNQFGHYLKANYQVSPDDLIGIKLERNELFIIAVLSILKAGAAYLPIDPGYPPERIAFLQQDSHCLATIDESFYRHFLLEKGEYPTFPVQVLLRPDNLIYLIYTSGSTGHPKGIMMKHAGMVNLMNFHQDEFPDGEVRRVLQFANLSFDVSFQEIFSTLLRGATLYPISEEKKKEVIGLTDFIVQRDIDTIFLPTAYFKLLMEEDYFLAHIGNSIRHIIVAGEQLVIGETFIRYLRTSNITLHNHYGPAETHVVTRLRLTGDSGQELKTVPSIGKPIANHQIYILSDHQSLLPIGAVGEICIGGAGLAKGYLNRDTLTRQKFIPSPFREGERIYRTGDLGRWLNNGNIDCLGRKDFQVKIRGYRIELGEIEQVLHQHAFIESTLVVVKEEVNGDKALVAYIVSSQKSAASELRDYAAGRLPAYMVPQYFVQLEKLPLTSNGKIDRQHLPDPEEFGRKAGPEYIPPLTATGKKLAGIWQNILGKERVGLKDNFFELGGQSLKLTRLASQIHKAFEVRVPLKDLFAKVILEEQVLLIGQAERSSFKTIPRAGILPDYPLSSAQRRLWVLSQFPQRNIAYNMAGIFGLEGSLIRPALEYAFSSLIDRHEIIRTVFREDEKGDIKQFINTPEACGFKVGYRDMRGTVAREDQVKQLAGEEAFLPFDLYEGPLLRAVLYQMEDNKWILTYTMHHIISDGWSMSIIRKELFSLYETYAGGKVSLSAWDPLRIQYKDYSVWQQSLLTAEALKTHKTYWLQQLEEVLPVLALPVDKVRPVIKTYHGDFIKKKLNARLSRALLAFSQEQGGTLFMGLLAVANVLIYRYTGQQDIIIGSPVAGRDHADLEEQIGFYVNQLALRARFSSADNYKKIFTHIRQITLDAYEHQAYPFDELIDALGLPRDLSRSPLFDVMLVLQNTESTSGGDQQVTDKLKLVEYEGTGGTSKFDLTFLFEQQGDEIQIMIEYNTDLWYEASIHRLADHFSGLLEVMLEHPCTPIGQIEYLSAVEKHRLINTFGASFENFQNDETLVGLFEKQAGATPHVIALQSEESELTYQELNEKANQLSDYLRKNYKIRPDDLVGIKMDRTERMIIAILGTLKAGAAYVPIDPLYPESRIDFLVQDSKCRLLIDEPEFACFLGGRKKYKSRNPKRVNRPDDLAYVIYTSGSTGQPKGVMIQHRNTCAFIGWCNSEFLNARFDTVLGVTSICFDLSVFEIFYTLSIGKKLKLLKDALSVRQNLGAPGKILLNTVPGVIVNLVAENTDLGSVSVLNMAGEPIPAGLLSKLDCRQIEIRNLYGPTETTTYSTVYRLTKDSPVLIGRPIAGTELYILNENLYVQPIGVTGEIYIGGSGLAKGYLNRPALTAEKFIQHPFAEGKRLYKTGDLGRWLHNGNIEYLGRKDDQVKIRGFRIEMGEIESVLLSHPEIDSAAVAAHPDQYGEKALVAYLVSRHSLNIAEVRTYLGKILPFYMLPARFVQLERLPLTPNGKIDKKNLPAHHGTGMSTGIEYIAPRNRVEERLIAIWQEILLKQKIGVKDDFFALGGHSLKLTRLAGLIHKAFDVRLGLKELFAASVPEAQALLIGEAKKVVYSGIERAPAQEYYALSPSQQRLWLMHKMGLDRTAYNMYGVYDFEEGIETDVLKRSVKMLMDRHEVLRTAFVEKDGLPLQKVLGTEELNFELDLVDLTKAKESGPVCKDIERELYAYEFDLRIAPLFKLILIKEDAKSRLLYSMHHIISDGWSMQIFERDILSIYRAELTGGQADLPVLKLQYKDYASWQNSLLRGENMKDQEKYWLQQLGAPLPDLQLPGDYETEEGLPDNSGKYFNLDIGPVLKKDIDGFLLDKKATLFTFLIACFKVVLNRITGETDLIVGIPVANRDHEDVKDLIGFFLNTLMLRDHLQENESFDIFLQQVNSTLLNGLENQAYPFEKLLEKLNIQRDRNRFPISSVFLNMPEISPTNEDRMHHPLPGHGEDIFQAKFDLECYFREYKNGISISCAYKMRLFKPETIEYWMHEFVAAVRQALEDPSVTIREMRLFGKPIFHQAVPGPVNTFSCFEEDLPNESIVSIFEARVKRYPHNVAVSQDNKNVSYSELNALANGLATGILTIGEPGGANISLLLEHGRSAVTGMLGVLKSGNAYVPLDPDYPPDRLRFILQDTGCKLMIASSETVQLAKLLSKDLPGISVIDISADINPVSENPGIEIKPDSRAYILYTSGSTGEPKGVIQRHRNVLHFIRVYTNNLHITSDDKLSLLPAYGFDASVSDIYSALLNGASLHPYDLRKKGVMPLANWLHAGEVSIIHMVPTIYRYFIAALKGDVFRHIRLVVLGGEAIYKPDLKNFKTHFLEGAFLVNTYGPTESSTVLQNFLDHNSVLNRRRIPIGAPVRDTSIYLLKENDQPAGVYQVGEIVYKSDYLSPGYLNRDELTKAVFITDPVTKNGRVYRSGDFGRMLPTGEIEFVGRKDNQVKLNGQRIELSGIEQNLLKIDGILESVVLLRTVKDQQKLVAYLRSEKKLTERMIRQELSGALPLYMIPAIYVFLDTFPLTPTGKINRTILPEPTDTEIINTAYIGPRNEMEERMVLIWQEVLGKEQIGIKDNFFELGGHSLKATQLIARINREFLVQISIRLVLQEPTIENISEHISFILDQNQLRKDREKLLKIDLI